MRFGNTKIDEESDIDNQTISALAKDQIAIVAEKQVLCYCVGTVLWAEQPKTEPKN